MFLRPYYFESKREKFQEHCVNLVQQIKNISGYESFNENENTKDEIKVELDNINLYVVAVEETLSGKVEHIWQDIFDSKYADDLVPPIPFLRQKE